MQATGHKIALNQPVSSSLPSEDGQNNLVSSSPSGGMPLNYPVLPETLQLSKTIQYSLQDIQQKIAENKINTVAVVVKIRQERITAPRISLYNSIKLLKHIAVTSKNTVSELSKATGMSESGLSKQLGLLKRKGYIVRVKFQEYKLTEKALQLLGSN